MVAESTEILGPIDQLGWLHACEGDMALRVDKSVCKNGPPEPVNKMCEIPDAAKSQ
jgi:hypothetical protein